MSYHTLLIETQVVELAHGHNITFVVENGPIPEMDVLITVARVHSVAIYVDEVVLWTICTLHLDAFVHTTHVRVVGCLGAVVGCHTICVEVLLTWELHHISHPVEYPAYTSSNSE